MEKSLDFTTHARTMMHERVIREEWVYQTVTGPDSVEERGRNERHCLKMIPESGGKFLRVIINPETDPYRVITVFFDRRVKP